MSFYIHTEADLDTAVAALTASDPRWRAALESAGRPALRRRPDGFAGLAQIVVSQQLSTASARAIWSRLEAALQPVSVETLLRARTPKLARTGLSAPKIRALKAIARAIRDGELDLAALADLDADEAHAQLTTIHGIGPWTADIYLLFCLGHADAWPAGDLALQEAARLLFALEARPSRAEMGPLAEAWRPWRGAAACMLWTYYRAAKGREGIVTAPAKAPAATRARKSPRTARSA
jgi:DNA-3-methyladenine glycosylase II